MSELKTCSLCKTAFYTDHPKEECDRFYTPIKAARKAERKAKKQRELHQKKKRIAMNKEIRKDKAPLIRPAKINWSKPELPTLDENDLVLKYLKTTILDEFEFDKAILHPKRKPKDAFLTIEIIVKNKKTKKRQSYGFNYMTIKKDIESGRLSVEG